nr:hypothetical protein CFP56_53740 [Quercus suber]
MRHQRKTWNRSSCRYTTASSCSSRTEVCKMSLTYAYILLHPMQVEAPTNVSMLKRFRNSKIPIAASKAGVGWMSTTAPEAAVAFRRSRKPDAHLGG